MLVESASQLMGPPILNPLDIFISDSEENDSDNSDDESNASENIYQTSSESSSNSSSLINIGQSNRGGVTSKKKLSNIDEISSSQLGTSE